MKSDSGGPEIPVVLVIDDDPCVKPRLEDYWRRFQAADAEVGSLSFELRPSPRSGIDALRDDREGRFRLVLLDYHFPDEAEPEPYMRVLQYWRQHARHVPILVFTREKDQVHGHRMSEDLRYVDARDTQPKYKDLMAPEFRWTLGRLIWKTVCEGTGLARVEEAPDDPSAIVLDFREGRRFVRHPGWDSDRRLKRAAGEIGSGTSRQIAELLLRLGQVDAKLFDAWHLTPSLRRRYEDSIGDTGSRLRTLLGRGCVGRLRHHADGRGPSLTFDPAGVVGRPFWCNVTEAHRLYVRAEEHSGGPRSGQLRRARLLARGAARAAQLGAPGARSGAGLARAGKTRPAGTGRGRLLPRRRHPLDGGGAAVSVVARARPGDSEGSARRVALAVADAGQR
ncbi:MAG: response regulator [Candidatus Riflebacteria bacterium]|nr:response regulator [Candidatus Riflebacteria bacterium]